MVFSSPRCFSCRIAVLSIVLSLCFHWRGAQAQVLPAVLAIRAVGGSYSCPWDLTIGCDSYIKARINGGRWQQSSRINRDDTPRWNFNVGTICTSSSTTINFEVHDYDSLNSDDLLQRSSFTIPALTMNTRTGTGTTTVASTTFTWTWTICASAQHGTCSSSNLACSSCTACSAGYRTTGSCGYGINTRQCLSYAPTRAPTPLPTRQPTLTPTHPPTPIPTTVAPTSTPSFSPTTNPTFMPTAGPTLTPSTSPSLEPSAAPTDTPSPDIRIFTLAPTSSPANAPSLNAAGSSSAASGSSGAANTITIIAVVVIVIFLFVAFAIWRRLKTQPTPDARNGHQNPLYEPNNNAVDLRGMCEDPTTYAVTSNSVATNASSESARLYGTVLEKPKNGNVVYDSDYNSPAELQVVDGTAYELRAPGVPYARVNKSSTLEYTSTNSPSGTIVSAPRHPDDYNGNGVFGGRAAVDGWIAARADRATAEAALTAKDYDAGAFCLRVGRTGQQVLAVLARKDKVVHFRIGDSGSRVTIADTDEHNDRTFADIHELLVHFSNLPLSSKVGCLAGCIPPPGDDVGSRNGDGLYSLPSLKEQNNAEYATAIDGMGDYGYAEVTGVDHVDSNYEC